MEKNILAFFKSPEEAQKAADQLEALGTIDMSIDRFSKYPGGSLNSIGNPVTGEISSLASLSLNADISGRDDGILLAAGTDASGYSDGGQGGPTGRDILLTVVVDESVHQQALQICEQAGGLV
ncbi:hypothetical protein J40TS1_03990 [Paenibacillus montaniterrae]|uniref:Uncharacterized protein n=1 Tax=Paenibacillus montaniterrae TaxID=429341 RepID=A0A919YK30_9BACL|nr:hypothetical protein J40TS1_03990 [Paenibacillus montaniterrae]